MAWSSLPRTRVLPEHHCLWEQGVTSGPRKHVFKRSLDTLFLGLLIISLLGFVLWTMGPRTEGTFLRLNTQSVLLYSVLS